MLLHTFLDSMRGAGHGDDEGEEREINHHGKTIKVGGKKHDVDPDSVSFLTRKNLSLVPQQYKFLVLNASHHHCSFSINVE